MTIRRFVGWSVIVLALPWLLGGFAAFALGVLGRAPLAALNETPMLGVLVAVASALALTVGDAIRGPRRR